MGLRPSQGRICTRRRLKRLEESSQASLCLRREKGAASFKRFRALLPLCRWGRAALERVRVSGRAGEGGSE